MQEGAGEISATHADVDTFAGASPAALLRVLNFLLVCMRGAYPAAGMPPADVPMYVAGLTEMAIVISTQVASMERGTLAYPGDTFAAALTDKARHHRCTGMLQQAAAAAGGNRSTVVITALDPA